MRRSFSAPWSTSLKISTGIFLALLAFVPILVQGSVAILIAVLLICTALLSVIGYRIENGRLFVQRLGWSNSFDLSDLLCAEAMPFVTSNSLRTFGIGGLFSYFGTFTNERLGVYQSYVTDPEKAVVLYFETRRTVVVSPDDPKTFVKMVEEEIWRLRKNLTGA